MSAPTPTSGGGATSASASTGAGSTPAVVLSYPFVPSVSAHFSLPRLSEEYSGLMLVRRCMFAAERCPTISVEAFRLALGVLKNAAAPTSFSATSGAALLSAANSPLPLAPSPTLYAEVIRRAHELLLTPSSHPDHQFFLSAASSAHVSSDPLFSLDQSFHSSVQRSFTHSLTHLENQLTMSKRDGEREGIKQATLQLGEFLATRAELGSSLNRYLEAKEFLPHGGHGGHGGGGGEGGAAQKELLAVALNIVRISIWQLNLTHVKTQVQRAQRLVKELRASGAGNEGEEREYAIIESKLQTAMGLFHMKGGNFHSAAHCFVQVTSDIQGSFSDVLSGSEVSVYGTICALASFSRQELKDHLLHNPEFKKLLDAHAPNTWKNILQQFYQSNYAEAFKNMEEIKRDLYLDLFLSSHVNRLFKQIRERAFVQYFKAYSCVELRVMSSAFNLDIPSLERTLSELIADNKISARIDSHNQLLKASTTDQRSETFERAIGCGDRYVREARAMAMRMSLIENDMAIKSGEGGGAASAASGNKRKGGRAGMAGAADEAMREGDMADKMRRMAKHEQM